MSEEPSQNISRRHRATPKSERGIYIVLVAFFSVVLIGLCALVFGLAAISTSRTRMNAISDAVALGLLQSYFTTPGTHLTKVAAAGTRGEEVLEQNGSIPFISGPLSGLVGARTPASSGSNSSGTYTFGTWYTELPPTLAQQVAACGTSAANYPCFRQATGSNPVANAVQVTLRNAPTNPLIAPFTRIFGNDQFTIKSASTATALQRCMVFLLDVSMSTTAETHEFDPYPKPTAMYLTNFGVPPPPHPVSAFVIGSPPLAAMYAYFQTGQPSLTPPPAVGSPSACSYWDTATHDAQSLYWCNQLRLRNGTPVPTSGPVNEHFLLSDYAAKFTDVIPPTGGMVWVDTLFDNYNTYFGPQPLSRFFLAFNTALRSVAQIKSPNDKAMVYAFTGARVSSEPPPPTPPQPQSLSTDLDFLIQLTNMANVGWKDTNGNPVSTPVAPNFVTKGWFPLYADDIISQTTNLPNALNDAMEALSGCPDSAKKVIILATDGIPTCGMGMSGGVPDPNPSVDCLTGDPYTRYRQAFDAILNTMVPTLAARRIAVTTLLDSPVLGLNIANVTATPGQYIDPSDAYGMGYSGIPPMAPTPGWNKPFFNITPQVVAADATAWADPGCTPGPVYEQCAGSQTPAGNPNDMNQLAFLNQNKPGYYLREPQGVWGQVAMATGGIVCNLMDPCPDSWYDVTKSPPEVVPTVRANGGFLNCAPFKETKAEQAQKCVLSAVGLAPEYLVEVPTATPTP